jgi:diguanylate cyclase (GGDEF)-like protein/PAS domain S-box-containing protein
MAHALAGRRGTGAASARVPAGDWPAAEMRPKTNALLTLSTRFPCGIVECREALSLDGTGHSGAKSAIPAAHARLASRQSAQTESDEPRKGFMSRSARRTGPDTPVPLHTPTSGRLRTPETGASSGKVDPARRGRTALLYRNAGLALAVTLVVAALLAVVDAKLDDVPLAALAWWCGVAAVAVARYLLAWNFRRTAPVPSATPRWRTLYIASTGALAFAWSGGAVLFMWNAPDVARLFTGTVLAVMVAGAVPVLAPVWNAFLSFALPLCMTVATVILLQARTPLHWAFGICILIFLGAMLASARYLNRTLAVAIRLAHEKGRLSEDLARASHAAVAMRDSDQKLRALYALSPLGIALTDMQGRYLDFNEAFLAICGYSADELKQLDYWALTPPEYAAQEDRQLESLSQTGRYGPYEKEFVRKDGRRVPLRLNGMLIGGNGGQQYIWSIVEDITDRKRIESDLRVAATAFDAQVGIIVTDAGARILRVNHAITEITGYGAEELVGQTPLVLRSGRHDDAFFEAIDASVRRDGHWQGEVWERRKSGEIYPNWMSVTAVKSDDGAVTHFVSTRYDVTERKAAEDEIKYLAFFDPLTRLPNRRLLQERLRQAVAVNAVAPRHGALLFIDLDNFKSLNDTLGHDQGDLLLQRVAQRLSSCVRECDTVARLGGDEFVVMIEDLSARIEEAVGQAESIGGKLAARLNQRFLLGSHKYNCTPSIGVTLFGGRHESIEELLKQADLAMYQAKAAGRNTLRFFDPKMQATVAERVALEADLRGAVREGRFVLHYQPQVDGRGCITGAEVLVRWLHPKRGLMLPNGFIPLAEETGLILPLGHWVLATACAQLAAWARQPDTARLELAVNVSVQQIRQPDFVQQVFAVIDRNGIDPRRLKLELTESLVTGDVEDAIAKLTALKARGVRIALDDFGTGYSSLTYLKRLPLDELKIDRSFVMDVLKDPSDAAIARTIVALARSLGLSVIAEGVETEEQRAFLARNGCDAYQGYFFGRPVPLEEFERELATSRAPLPAKAPVTALRSAPGSL